MTWTARGGESEAENKIYNILVAIIISSSNGLKISVGKIFVSRRENRAQQQKNDDEGFAHIMKNELLSAIKTTQAASWRNKTKLSSTVGHQALQPLSSACQVIQRSCWQSRSVV